MDKKPTENIKLSVVVPVYNEEDNIVPFVAEVKSHCSQYDIELILVDDGSTDSTCEVIRNIINEYHWIKLISFARNFGHQNALKAGLDHANGEILVMLDGDLQHPPALIPQMVDHWREGFKVVQTIREYKDQNPFKVFTSNAFYRLINSISDLKLKSGSADFRLIDRIVLDLVKKNDEYHLFLRGLFSWYGFKTKYVNYKAEPRFTGETKYSLTKMINLSVSGITGFSIKPLRLSIVLGFFISFGATIYMLYALYIKVFTNATVEGWTSLMIVITLIGGIQLILLGVIGEYIGKIFQQIKRRPQYIIEQKIGFDE